MKKITVSLSNGTQTVFNDPKDAAWISDGVISIYKITDIEDTEFQYPFIHVISIKTETS